MKALIKNEEVNVKKFSFEDGKIFRVSRFIFAKERRNEENKNNCTMLIWKSDMFYARIFCFIIWCAIESDETVDDEKSAYKVPLDWIKKI